ncbi:MAG TPA: hypothetical protein VMY37_27970 [Thermoguttaceae bacterium]|nr:hypothetical protein [Thermoguttaceae bacterium]
MSDSDILALSELRAAREATNPRRPWYRLHLSTLVVVLLLLVPLILIMVPGRRAGVMGPWSLMSTVRLERQEHGWPWVHVDRVFAWSPNPQGRTVVQDTAGIADYLDGEEARSLRRLAWPRLATASKYDYNLDEEPAWSSAYNWPLGGRTVAVHKLALALNLATALLICAAVAVTYEWWRRRRHRLCQFHLRELLLLVLIVSAGLAWWRALAAETARESELIRRLQQSGCVVDRRCLAPVWLRTLAGTRHLQLLHRADCVHIDCVHRFAGTEATIARDWTDLRKLIQRFRHLKQVSLHGADDAEVAQVAQITSVRSLVLDDARVTDGAFRSIERMVRLKTLVVDAGAPPPTEITDTALAHLKRLENLRILRLITSHYEDPSRNPLKITDSGLAHLAGMRALERLDLSGCDITDAGIVHLKKMVRLRELWIGRTLVTKAGAEELRQALPDTQVHHWGRGPWGRTD